MDYFGMLMLLLVLSAWLFLSIVWRGREAASREREAQIVEEIEESRRLYG